MSIVDNVRSKAEEYGLKIFDDYPVESKEYVFFIEDMMLFVNEEEKTIGVSFQASAKPEHVGNMILILNEMNEELDIIESFIFDKNNRYLSGDKAFELIEKTKQSEIIQNFIKQQTFNEILIKAKCHEC
jgi:hypothetical protein